MSESHDAPTSTATRGSIPVPVSEAAASREASSHSVDCVQAVSPDIHSWRSAIASLITPLWIEPLRDDFRGQVSATTLGDVTVFEMMTTPHVVERKPEHIARSHDHFFKVSVQLAGTTQVHQDGRTTLLQPGDLAIYDTNRPYSLRIEEPSRAVILLLAEGALRLPAADVGRVTAVSFTAENGLSRLVNPFLRELVGNVDLLSGPYGARVLYSGIDLFVTMLSKEINAQEGSPNQHRSLARTIRSYIEDRLHDLELTPLAIARAHYISPRQLHSIFAEEGMSVAAWIRRRRLDQIRRELVDPVLSTLSISAIARRSGLADAAHFSKLFRAEYGESPRDWRARAGMGGQGELVAAVSTPRASLRGATAVDDGRPAGHDG